MSMKTSQLRLNELKHLKGVQCPFLTPSLPPPRNKPKQAWLIQTRRPVRDWPEASQRPVPRGPGEPGMHRLSEMEREEETECGKVWR